MYETLLLAKEILDRNLVEPKKQFHISQRLLDLLGEGSLEVARATAFYYGMDLYIDGVKYVAPQESSPI